ncbi:MAG: hypothetical protein NUV63_05740 [Gallionella sp.]|nr:hypothetical protein [Gallionella sp.]
MYALYRCLGKNGKPIYIGMSLSIYRRITAHKNSSHWFNEVHSITISRFLNIDSCRLAEKKAIFHERPKYNKQEMEKENQKRLRRNRDQTLKRNLAKLAVAKKRKAVKVKVLTEALHGRAA